MYSDVWESCLCVQYLATKCVICESRFYIYKTYSSKTTRTWNVIQSCFFARRQTCIDSSLSAKTCRQRSGIASRCATYRRTPCRRVPWRVNRVIQSHLAGERGSRQRRALPGGRESMFVHLDEKVLLWILISWSCRRMRFLIRPEMAHIAFKQEKRPRIECQRICPQHCFQEAVREPPNESANSGANFSVWTFENITWHL